jgi:hypothetical protein
MAYLYYSLHGRLFVWWVDTSNHLQIVYLNKHPGYDTGVISAVLVSLGTDLGHKLDANEQELITSLTSGGALVGAVIAGLSADKVISFLLLSRGI